MTSQMCWSKKTFAQSVAHISHIWALRRVQRPVMFFR